jgi:hypothetical protein
MSLLAVESEVAPNLVPGGLDKQNHIERETLEMLITLGDLNSFSSNNSVP